MRFLSIVFILISFGSFGQKKVAPTEHNTIVVNQTEATYKFQTSQEKLETNPINELTYYWCKSNEIHTTKGGYYGMLLYGTYSVFYLSEQLKEQGEFDKGLKTGEWKTWFENGEIREIFNYKKGALHGGYKKYNEKGEVTLEAEYKNGLLNGETKSYSNGKLLKTTSYKDGQEIIREVNQEGDSTKSGKLMLFKQKGKQEESTPKQ